MTPIHALSRVQVGCLRPHPACHSLVHMSPTAANPPSACRQGTTSSLGTRVPDNQPVLFRVFPGAGLCHVLTLIHRLSLRWLPVRKHPILLAHTVHDVTNRIVLEKVRRPIWLLSRVGAARPICCRRRIASFSLPSQFTWA